MEKQRFNYALFLKLHFHVQKKRKGPSNNQLYHINKFSKIEVYKKISNNKTIQLSFIHEH